MSPIVHLSWMSQRKDIPCSRDCENRSEVSGATPGECADHGCRCQRRWRNDPVPPMVTLTPQVPVILAIDLELTHVLLVLSIAGVKLTHLIATAQRFRQFPVGQRHCQSV